MKILWILQQGIGNVVQTIPAYLNIRNHLGRENIDVRYIRQYAPDAYEKACFYPDTAERLDLDIAAYYTRQYNEKKKVYYDYIIKPPFVLNPDGTYNKEYSDQMREEDTEVQRSLRIAEFLGAKTEMLKDIHMPCVPTKTEGPPTIAVCNGGLSIGNWQRKKYPYFEKLVEKLNEKYPDHIICSVGNSDEYVKGTGDCTGSSLHSAITTIYESDFYIGTDTGLTHIAALLDKSGVALYTTTDPRKNHDPDFHKSLTVIQRDNPECTPPTCQLRYHWLFTRKCEKDPAPCQLIQVGKIMKAIDGKA